MRILAAVLMLVLALAQLALGASLLLAARVERVAAREAAGDLSSVAGDLADEQTLARDRARAAAAADTGASTRQLVCGLLCGVPGLGLLVAAVLLLTRRARGLALGLSGLSTIALITSALLLGGSVPLLCAAGLGGVTCICVALSRV